MFGWAKLYMSKVGAQALVPRRRVSRLAWLVPAVIDSMTPLVVPPLAKHTKRFTIARHWVLDRLAKTADKLVLKVLSKLIWKAAKKVVE